MADTRALTVSEAMGLAKRALEGVRVRVLGEVSELADKPGYKAVYFTVADGGACMPCLMWRDAYERSGVRLRLGEMVQVAGAFTAYAPKGRMQFQVSALEPAGEGVLRMRVAQLARELESQGLMRPERKRPLPAHASRIGVVTSPRGKAVHDVIRTLRRRYPVAEVLLAGVAVEGPDAAVSIVEGLRVVAAAGAEVVVLGRGGGSYEDLMPFNAEAVARAVAACPVPVVTGIGHEPDTTIADMVADVRASTPTAAAEAAAPSGEEIGRGMAHLSRRLGRGLERRLSDASHAVRLLVRRPVFVDPAVALARQAQSLDAAADALSAALPLRLARDTERLQRARERLAVSGRRAVERAADRAAVTAARLNDLSPLAILGRGYALCYRADGRTVLRSSAEVGAGERVRVRLAEGVLGCVVEGSEE
ncbi:MAG: exodeoxyribonuclease VII large subunit [Coriobacteriia bacterium]|nr:exodeoxyribonuclease VII large subunit [Coriobacteriia bacterium]